MIYFLSVFSSFDCVYVDITVYFPWFATNLYKCISIFHSIYSIKLIFFFFLEEIKLEF